MCAGPSDFSTYYQPSSSGVEHYCLRLGLLDQPAPVTARSLVTVKANPLESKYIAQYDYCTHSILIISR